MMVITKKCQLYNGFWVRFRLMVMVLNNGDGFVCFWGPMYDRKGLARQWVSPEAHLSRDTSYSAPVMPQLLRFWAVSWLPSFSNSTPSHCPAKGPTAWDKGSHGRHSHGTEAAYIMKWTQWTSSHPEMDNQELQLKINNVSGLDSYFNHQKSDWHINSPHKSNKVSRVMGFELWVVFVVVAGGSSKNKMENKQHILSAWKHKQTMDFHHSGHIRSNQVQ